MVLMQDLFYEDDTVLFIDMHQNEVWPGSGQINESGTGKGEGTTINVPMPGAIYPAAADSIMSGCMCPAHTSKLQMHKVTCLTTRILHLRCFIL